LPPLQQADDGSKHSPYACTTGDVAYF